MSYRLTLHAALFAALLFLTHWVVLAAVDLQVLPTTEFVGPTADGGWIMPTGHKVRISWKDGRLRRPARGCGAGPGWRCALCQG